MENNNLTQKEFTEALNALIASETFNVTLTDNQTYTFSQLTTNQLKSLVQAVVDSPITQSVFNSTISLVMKDSLKANDFETNFNTIDRLIFCLKTRIESLSPTLNLAPENGKEFTVDLQKVLDKILEIVNKHISCFKTQRIASSNGEMSVVCGIPLIDTDIKMSEELYKNTIIEVDTPEELRKALGNAFIYEIAKSIREVQLENKILDFSTLPFKTRVSMVETFPTSLVKSVISYIETYKGLIDECLKIDNEHSVPLDGSLFSLR